MKYIFYLLIITGLSSCVSVKDVTVGDITDARVVKFDKTGVQAEAKVRINNPNKFKIKVVRSDVDLIVNKVVVGKANLTDKIIINPTSDEIYTFGVDADLKKLLMGQLGGGIFGLPGLMPTGAVDIQLKGHLKVKARGFGKKIPIDLSKKMDIPKNLPSGL